jgi:hypothetical protein
MRYDSLLLSFIGSRDESGASLLGPEGVVSMKYSATTLKRISSPEGIQLQSIHNYHKIMSFYVFYKPVSMKRSCFPSSV